MSGDAQPVPLAKDLSGSNPESGQTNEDFRIAGHWVAWTLGYWSDEGTGWSGELIELRDLQRKGRAVEQQVTLGSVKRITPRQDGAVAWLLSVDGYYELDKLDSRAMTPEPLAFSREIDPASLRVDRRGVSWRQAGSERRAALR